MDTTSILLVEGQADVDFFEALLRKLKMLDKVKIRPPKNFGLKTNTVSHFPKLINLLMKRMNTNQIHHLGIVADADYVSGGGFEQRWQQLTASLATFGYRIPSNPPKLPYLGSIFHHSDLSSVGLWLMPNHEKNGMLEDLIFKTIKKAEDQKKLLNTAISCVDNLPIQLFSTYHNTKAIIYSWLSWQKRPGQTLDVTVNGNLIDLESKEMQGFINWLYKVFEINN